MGAFSLLILVVFLALIFDFINGFHDSANAIATVVSTKVLSPGKAVLYGGILNFIGALSGTAVAATIGKGLVDSHAITIETVLCAVIGAILWNLLTWLKGLPTSSSHALIGSLVGATVASASGGVHSVSWGALMDKVVLPMVGSPMLGIMGGFALMFCLTWMIYKRSLFKINRTFGRLQIISAGFMALSHGMNDAQKSMGIIGLALVLTYPGHAFMVPLWAKAACALAMGLGTASGGWRIIRTVGSKMIHLQPTQGFAAETTGALIIATASHFGIPVSTTHVITSAIMGVGATQRLSTVRWGVVGEIVWAWVLTLPLTFLFSAALMYGFRLITGLV
jgi:PiT family inorganic phosphate transporter